MNIVRSWSPRMDTNFFSISGIEILLKISVPLIAAILINHFVVKILRIPKRLENPRSKTYFSVFRSAISIIIYVTAVYYVFTSLNINVTPLFASAGVIGIIIGLGVRPVIEDFFTGVLLLTQDTISVGDYVEIGTSEGVVESLGLRTIRLKDQNGAIHIFPNSEVNKIINYSRRMARVVIDIPIKPNQSIDTAIEALKKSITELKNDKILAPLITEGSSVLGIERISGGSILIRSLIITRAAFRWDVARKYRYIALKNLSKSGIQLT